jgi:hypothetical protein
MLSVGTLGDAMKIESGMRAKVVTLSIKDRAAILTGGRSADLAIWYDGATGRFTSSTAYAAEPPAWLADKGAALPAAARARAAPWTPLPVPKGLEALVPPDDRPGEGAYEGWGKTFPHALAGEPEPLQKRLYRMTPEAMEDLFALALVAVDELKLGADAEPDLLVVSVSTTDYIGHNYGPDSREQLEMLRRADGALRAFMAALEKRVGRKEIVVALSADHGSTPPPLTLAGTRAPVGVLVTSEVEAAAERGLHEALPKDKKKRLLGYITPQVFLDLVDLSADDARRAIDAVRAQIARVDGVAHVYDMTRAHDDDSFARLMDESAPPGRHAQLFVRQQPRTVVVDKRDAPGTDHGSPYTYDRRVPVIVAGPGVAKGRYADAVDPRDVAPTLAFLLGVPPPDACQGRVLSAVRP